jgi:hypothetical protein
MQGQCLGFTGTAHRHKNGPYDISIPSQRGCISANWSRSRNLGHLWTSFLSRPNPPRPKAGYRLLCNGRQEQRDGAGNKTFRRVPSSSWRGSHPSASSESSSFGSPPAARSCDTFATEYAFHTHRRCQPRTSSERRYRHHRQSPLVKPCVLHLIAAI